MKKLFAILSVSLLSVFGIFFSCSDLNEVTDSESSGLIMPEAYKIIGIKHNEALEAAFQSLRQYYTQQSRAVGEVKRIDKTQCYEIMVNGMNDFLKTDGIDIEELNLTRRISRSTGGDDLEITPIDKDHILYEYNESLKSVLDGEFKTESQLLYELNQINNKASENLSEQDAAAVYAGTCTCYYSYEYWKLNYIKWWVALNMPELLSYYSDERINDLIIDNFSNISPISPQYSALEADWIYEEWIRTGETRQMLANELKKWWNNGGAEIVFADASGAVGGAIKAVYISGGTLSIPGAIGEGALMSITVAIGKYFGFGS